ncbi:MAG: NADH-quinone oxidoreductase subunit A [Verrucomicrobiae bacterium]|jgi:NADH-quinone oxidoreductase subunit A|nr:NADH-quinone oxidoreductase subunit A [Verrucomicrobiae bacterium]
MTDTYGSLLVHVVVSLAFALSIWFASLLLGRIGTAFGVKNAAYECGMIPKMTIQPRFSVKFYLVAMLFILFDIEVVFMVPWAVCYRDFIVQYGDIILGSMLSFVTILMVGYIYAIKKGALEFAS